MFFTTVFEKEIESYAFIHKKYKNSKVFWQKLQENLIIRMALILIFPVFQKLNFELNAEFLASIYFL